MKRMLTALALILIPALSPAAEPDWAPSAGAVGGRIMPAVFFDLFCGGATQACTLINPTFGGTSLFTGPIEVRSGATPGAIRVYNSYTDANNGEWLELAWGSNIAKIQTTKNGTGVGRALDILTTGTSSNLRFGTGASARWAIDWATFNFSPVSDSLYDLGASGSRIRDLFMVRSIQAGLNKALTSGAAAVPIMRVSIASNSFAGGEMIWEAHETNATDYQSLAGRIRFAGVNKAGAMTCTVNVVGTDLLAQSTASTFTCTWTNVAATNACDLSATCTTGLATPGSIDLRYRLDMAFANTLTAQ